MLCSVCPCPRFKTFFAFLELLFSEMQKSVKNPKTLFSPLKFLLHLPFKFGEKFVKTLVFWRKKINDRKTAGLENLYVHS